MSVIFQYMSRNRYELILRVLHFSKNRENVANPEDMPPDVKAAKMEPIIKALRQNFGNALIPFLNLSIDESLHLYKGRWCYIQYIPSKRSRFGFKFFMIVDNETGF